MSQIYTDMLRNKTLSDEYVCRINEAVESYFKSIVLQDSKDWQHAYKETETIT